MIRAVKSLKMFYTLLLCLLFVLSCQEENGLSIAEDGTSSYPSVIFTKSKIDRIKKGLGNTPLYDQSLKKVQTEVDEALSLGIVVPVPKDLAGGFTHTQHKFNYDIAYKAGMLYQITGKEVYLDYVRDLLLAYADIYTGLDRHPAERSYARGKIFWQCLNDANWLVYMSQAYDCIRGVISEEDRETLDTKLFKPFADFLSKETPQFFNRIHNHSTWGNVAVGMAGLVLEDDDLLQIALYGLPSDGLAADQEDNDGGLIKQEGQKAGFYANLDEPFSPDGYYTEGPYYQRYAMYPFLIFAQALETKKPELKIFEYNDGVLIKAVHALINLTDENGAFFPLNDGQKGMSYHAPSLVSAIDIAYYFGSEDAQLLSIAEKQGQVQLDVTGFAVAQAIADQGVKPFEKKSIILRDGSKGDEGGLAIIRANHDQGNITALMKNTAHGLSHGHFDKLSYSLYKDDKEVLQDYGLVRYVNVSQKSGGGYLSENKTWAKQTIAHNTVVQDEVSHFKGNFKQSSKYHPDITASQMENTALQFVAATENNAYPDTQLQRALLVVNKSEDAPPYLLDIFRIKSAAMHQYDLPLYYHGQIMQADDQLKLHSSLEPLGKKSGYQHIWNEGVARSAKKSSQLTWYDQKQFYTRTTTLDPEDELIYGRVGANDPDYNLRSDPVVIHRKKGSGTVLFASIVESHGSYNYATEKASNAFSKIASIEEVKAPAGYLALKLSNRTGAIEMVLVSDNAFAKTKNKNQINKQHSVEVEGKTYNWTGDFTLQTNK